MRLLDLFKKPPTKSNVGDVVNTPVSVDSAPQAHEDEEFVNSTGLGDQARKNLKRELAAVKNSDPVLYDKIVNHK